MRLADLLDKWSLKGLKISAGFLDAEFVPNDADADAAWELYVELLTRVTTQALPENRGDEVGALTSVHKIFDITREILRKPGRRQATVFAKLAVVILNQKIRPFTTRWHRLNQAGGFQVSPHRDQHVGQFWSDLSLLQADLNRYAGLLSEVARVEDLCGFETEVGS